MVEKAINYLLKEVIDPSLKSKKLEQKYKNKIQNSKNLIRNFNKIGDLYRYLERFQDSHGSGNDDLYKAMKKMA
jgi:5-methylcytosine-specific restriction protein A